MASPQAEAIKELYAGWLAAMAAKPDMGLDEMRELFDHWGDITAEPGGVDYVEVDAGGVSAMWALPHGCAEDRVALCTHGGGYVTGSMYTHRKLFGHIAKAIGCQALILDYRRAPEHTHPAQVEDAVTAYAWLLDQGYKPEHICTTGDSAGGALSTSVLLGIKARGLPLPVAAMPMSPWYDPEGTGESLVRNADKDVLVKPEVLKGMAGTFLGKASSKDPLANLLQADLAGLPPIYIQTGGDETLLDDSTRFAEKAKAAGIDVKLDVFPEMQHVFHFLAGRAPEADDAIRRMAAWVKPKLDL
ncbi:MAG: alpha/beta hydrolase [Gammaproteobacteria bacterium]|nr:alpha/beta hydrolase [Gammaproteobacteria bacterium]MCP5198544.1 alpha/beta hydrolase [Gammaproteobacteria bacterium]